MKKFAIITLSTIASVGICIADPTAKENLPKKVADFKADLMGMSRNEAYNLTIKSFGKPARDVGSGFRIEQWDIEGGKLTFHQAIGPTFEDSNGVITWLINTKNEVESNVVGSYEMYSLHEQDPNKQGSGYWLGNIDLKPSGKYVYRDSGQFKEYKKTFPVHFFVANSKGSFEIVYSEGVKPTSSLEEIKDGVELCKISFRSGKNIKVFGIVIDAATRRLKFTSKDQVFRMNRGWNQYWATKN